MNTLRFWASALCAVLALAACGDDDQTPAGDAAAPDASARDSGSPDVTPPACSPAPDGESVDVQLASGMGWPVFVASDDGAVGVLGGATGYRMLALDRHGAVRMMTQTLWPGEIGAETPQLALSGDV